MLQCDLDLAGELMSTITIRLEDDLTSRVAGGAECEGKTAHAFIVDAIARAVEQVELYGALHQVAEARWARVLNTGKTVAWDDAVKVHLTARARGEQARRPATRKFLP